MSRPRRSQARLATEVAAGILLSRVAGFARQFAFAHYFGTTAVADALQAAFRIPNALRNLLGEGTLSASFIPVYAGMLERGERENARVLAGTIASLLMMLTAAAALLGMLLAPVITAVVAPGFTAETRTLTVRLVQILFPMVGVTVLAAWCLGVLNTHGRFLLSYATPAVWNVAQIATLVALGGVLAGARLAVALAFGALAGSLLQFAIQLPATLRLAGRFHWGRRLDAPGVRAVLRAWGPVVIGAGVVQVSSIVEVQLGTLLGPGAVAVLGYAQLVALLPISLFGASVAAASLPEMSRDAAGQDPSQVRRRLGAAARRVVYYVVPSAFGFAALGTPIVAALFQTGRFSGADTQLAAAVLAAYSIGLLAQSSVKLFASGFYALGDTRTPVRVAILGVVLSASLAAGLMQLLGPEGIALGAGIAAFVNVGILLRLLERRIGPIIDATERRPLLAVLAGALLGTGAGGGTATLLAGAPRPAVAAGAILAFILAYGVGTLAVGHSEARRLVALLRRPTPRA